MRGRAIALCTEPTTAATGQGRTRLSADVTVGGESTTVWFDVPQDMAPTDNLADPFVIAALLPAMRCGEDLVVEGTVTPGLLSNLDELQSVYSLWFPRFTKITITATQGEPLGDDAAIARGLFFSGGVDSFHSALSHPGPIDRLVYIDGLDTISDDPQLHREIRQSVRAAATGLGIPLVEVGTNVRSFLSPHAFWAEHAHGPALAATGHALAGGLTTIVMAADRTYAQLKPWGADPTTIPMLSSQRMGIENYGWGTMRFDKVAGLALSGMALSHLRVCWENRDSRLNCGRCEKCLRTMLSLEMVGALESCRAFDVPIDLDRVAATELTPTWADYWVEIIEQAPRSRDREPLFAAMQTAIDRAASDIAVERLGRDLAPATASPAIAAWVSNNRDQIYGLLSAHEGRWLFLRVVRDLPSRVVRKLRTMLTRSRTDR